MKYDMALAICVAKREREIYLFEENSVFFIMENALLFGLHDYKINCSNSIHHRYDTYLSIMVLSPVKLVPPLHPDENACYYLHHFPHSNLCAISVAGVLASASFVILLK